MTNVLKRHGLLAVAISLLLAAQLTLTGCAGIQLGDQSRGETAGGVSAQLPPLAQQTLAPQGVLKVGVYLGRPYLVGEGCKKPVLPWA